MRVQRLLIWFLLCAAAATIFSAYALTSRTVGRGAPLLPLDDVYIHFQYARSLADGHPYRYNPDGPPTSGATSFLYPYLLAGGYLLGFRALELGLWAQILGGLALLGALGVVYRLVRLADAPPALSLLLALGFGLTGAVSWHFMSGMETGLVMLLALLTLYAFAARRFGAFVAAAVALALMRPEAGALAALAALVAGVTWRRSPWLLLPLVALLIQPGVNALVTGSMVASGGSAKSILSAVPFDAGVAVGRVVENLARIATEWLTGYSPREGWYLPPLIGVWALIGLGMLLRDPARRAIGVLIALWLLAGAGAVATLDTAFWHFKRYQMPLLALTFPLAAWALVSMLRAGRALGYAALGWAGLLLPLFALWSGAAFLGHFALNVEYVYRQPYQMAEWLQAQTPPDARVAVHDVGLMRYHGERTTLDMVGLTTPGAAAYWRSGPGAVAEFLLRHQPDYIASYGHGHGFGLGMLADTSIYGEPLIGFGVDLDPRHNVALAADFQGIYQPDWRLIRGRQTLDAARHDSTAQILNVADLESEAAFDYRWSGALGFPTEVYELPIRNCAQIERGEVDGVRAITDSEQLTVAATPGEGLQLATVFHALHGGSYSVYADDALIDVNSIPTQPGCWVMAWTHIPAERISGDAVTIRIVPGPETRRYLPAYHVINPAPEDMPAPRPATVGARFGESVALVTGDLLRAQQSSILLDLRWWSDGQMRGDHKLFVHVLDAEDRIVAQYDGYPAWGTPPANWFPGELVYGVRVDWDAPLVPGVYRVALGLYDSVSLERLMPTGDALTVSPDGRVFLGEFEVEADE